MLTKKAVTSLSLAVFLTLTMASCAPQAGTDGTRPGASYRVIPETLPPAEEGFVSPGEVVSLEVGEPVTYYSYAALSRDDAQRVTIDSVEYIEMEDLPVGAPLEQIKRGILSVTVTWESVKGKVLSHPGYIGANVQFEGHGMSGYSINFMANRLESGWMEPGETRSGVVTFSAPRGMTTIYLLDYVGKQVATVRVDTTE